MTVLTLLFTYVALELCDRWQDACQVAHDPPDVHSAGHACLWPDGDLAVQGP